MAGIGVADLTGDPGPDEMVVLRFRVRWMTDEHEAALEAQRKAEGKQGTASRPNWAESHWQRGR